MAKPRKLVLYSGGQNRSNHQLHQALVDLVGSKKRIRMAYVPFCEDGCQIFFKRFERRYGRYGATDFQCLPVDVRPKRAEMEKALKGDIIYLAGGNTFYFLKHLRSSGLLARLKTFAEKGGVLAGLSAGAIMLTPNIELAAYPPFEPDENDVGIRNLKALGLVKFEFLPHFVNSKRMNEAMLMYSLLSKNPVLACPDGSGVVIDGWRKTYFGPAYIFHRGQKINLDPR